MPVTTCSPTTRLRFQFRLGGTVDEILTLVRSQDLTQFFFENISIGVVSGIRYPAIRVKLARDCPWEDVSLAFLVRILCDDDELGRALFWVGSDFASFLDFTGRAKVSGLGKLGDDRGRGLQQRTMVGPDMDPSDRNAHTNQSHKAHTTSLLEDHRAERRVDWEEI